MHADIVVSFEIASIEEPADGGVGDGLGTAGEVDQVIVPRPGLPHRSQGKRWREFDRNVAICGVIASCVIQNNATTTTPKTQKKTGNKLLGLV